MTTQLTAPLGLHTDEIARWYAAPITSTRTAVSPAMLAPEISRAVGLVENRAQALMDCHLSMALPASPDVLRLQIHGLERGWRLQGIAVGPHHGAVSDGKPEPSLASAVDVVRELQNRLRLPLSTILKASSIRQRTFYSWETCPDVSPRLSSLGRLWSLKQCVEDLEMLYHGRTDWVRDPARVRLLERGHFAELVDSATSATARTTSMPILYTGDDSVVADTAGLRQRPSVNRVRRVPKRS